MSISNIINDKLELVNRIGELLDSIMVEVQNVVDMVRETDNDSLICDILAENLKKWKDDILELINSVNVCAKPDTKKKDKPDTKKKDKPDTKRKDKPGTKKKDKPDTKKKDKPDAKKKDKPDTKKKDKPDTKKKDKTDTKKKDKPDIKKKDKPDTKEKDKSDIEKKDKPDTKKKGDKPDTKKKDDKPDTKKKADKPDTSKNNIENRVSNRIKYEIQDIGKYRKVLIKMIDERINMLDVMNMELAESIADIQENKYESM